MTYHRPSEEMIERAACQIAADWQRESEPAEGTAGWVNPTLVAMALAEAYEREDRAQWDAEVAATVALCAEEE